MNRAWNETKFSGNVSMKLAYFDCLSGISGDMTLGALVDAGVPLTILNEAVQSVCGEARLVSETVSRKDFRAVQVQVLTSPEHHHAHEHHHAEHAHHHKHRHLSDILKLIEDSPLSSENKRRASEIFQLIAEAEAFVHGTEIENVHFHEIGAVDSIADIIGVVVGLDYLGVNEILASPVPTGTGTVEIAHGLCSIPAPATAELLRGIPLAASDVPFELTTPTGAAILKYYVKNFGPMPAMTIQSIGVGAGSRDLVEQPNILRLIIGDVETEKYHLRAAMQQGFDPMPISSVSAGPKSTRQDSVSDPFAVPVAQERVWMLETNLDDVSGELVGHCVEQLWFLNPLDVWITPIQMKKHRPGITLSVLCRREQIEAVENMIFSETTTIGVRRFPVERTVLGRENCLLNTSWGPVDAKRTVLPDGKEKTAPEFESVRKLAAEHDVTAREILEAIR